MADDTNPPKAIEVLSYSLSYSASGEPGDPAFTGSVEFAGGDVFEFVDLQAPGLVLALHAATNRSPIADDGGKDVFVHISAIEKQQTSGPEIYQFEVFLDGETGSDGSFSFSETLAAYDSIL